jgi:hypothetical protein
MACKFDKHFANYRAPSVQILCLNGHTQFVLHLLQDVKLLLNESVLRIVGKYLDFNFLAPEKIFFIVLILSCPYNS